jgi:hypothetical protein
MNNWACSFDCVLIFRNRIVSIIFFLLSIQNNVQSQNLSTDSLEKQVNTLRGTEKASALYELLYYYLRSDKQKAEHYNQQIKDWIRNETDPATLAYLGMAAVHIVEELASSIVAFIF